MKEPMTWGIWFGFILLIIFLVPWWYPADLFSTMIFGIPFWAFAEIVLIVCLTAYTYYVIMKKWDVERFLKD